MELFDGITRLTERQKEILRLLFNGHDAKSAACELGISIHTVNEHLSEARKNLGVSSSRTAARLFARSEAIPPRIGGHDSLGVAALPDDKPNTGSTGARKRFVLAGGIVMVIFAAAITGFLFGHAGTVAEVAKTPPRVVSTSPADGSTMAPGPFNLTVRFDRPMQDRSYSFVQVSADTFPDCSPKAQLSADGRAYTMKCTAPAGRSYEVWFNRPPYMNFRSRDGQSAQPHRIRFRTKSR